MVELIGSQPTARLLSGVEALVDLFSNLLALTLSLISYSKQCTTVALLTFHVIIRK